MALDTRTAPRPQRALRPLQWLRASLRPIRLQAATVPDPSTAPASGTGRGQALRNAHAELRALFDGQQGLRHVLPHLSLLERAIARTGSRALAWMPATVMQCALEQLEELRLCEGDGQLAVLRLRIVEALAMRQATAGISPAAREPFDDPRLRDAISHAFGCLERRLARSQPLSRH